ncbi:MAG: anthranilate synthase component I family protein, partial [Candidatus Adiutrix sp.]|nr:anthranilate synthase component I family protein [Candidatus Adiutrix sp.]
MTIVLKQKVRRLDNDLETIIGLYLSRLDRGSGVLLESAEVDGRWGRHSLAAGDFLLAARCVEGRLALEIKDPRLEPLMAYAGLDYLDGLRQLMKSLRLEPDPDFPRLPAMTRALYGFLGYGAATLMEKKLHRLLPPAAAEAAFILPARLYFFDHAYNQLVEVSLLED